MSPTLSEMISLVVDEEDINLLLENAAIIRASFLGGDGTFEQGDDPDDHQQFDQADRFDDLAAKLIPFCVPPLTPLERECAHCTDGVRWGSPCKDCLGTGLWPPTKDGVRLRLSDLRKVKAQ